MLKMVISPELARVCLVTTFISFGPTTPSGTRKVWSWRASPRPTDMRVGWYNKCVSVSLTRMRIGGSKSVTAWVENERSFSRQWCQHHRPCDGNRERRSGNQYGATSVCASVTRTVPPMSSRRTLTLPLSSNRSNCPTRSANGPAITLRV